MAFRCQKCGNTFPYPQASPLYTCPRCRAFYNRLASIDGQLNRCPECGRYGRFLQSVSCPECGGGPVENCKDGQ